MSQYFKNGKTVLRRKPRSARQKVMAEKTVDALLELIRGVFGEREFTTMQFADATALTRANANSKLLRLYDMGKLQRRRERICWWCLVKKDGVIKWRKSDCDPLTDEDREAIARVAARRAMVKYDYLISFEEFYSVALVETYRDFNALDNRDDIKEPRAWQYVILRDRAYSMCCARAKRELRHLRNKKRQFLELKWIGRRDVAAMEIEREKTAKRLAAYVADLVPEVGSPKERAAYLEALETGKESVGQNFKLAGAALAGKLGKEIFGLTDEDLIDYVDDPEQVVALTNSPTRLEKETNKTEATWWGKKHWARKNAFGKIVEECLNGDRAVPKREFKNAELARELEAALG